VGGPLPACLCGSSIPSTFVASRDPFSIRRRSIHVSDSAPATNRVASSNIARVVSETNRTRRFVLWRSRLLSASAAFFHEQHQRFARSAHHGVADFARSVRVYRRFTFCGDDAAAVADFCSIAMKSNSIVPPQNPFLGPTRSSGAGDHDSTKRDSVQNRGRCWCRAVRGG